MVKQLEDIKSVVFPKTADQIIYEKLMGDEIINREDVVALQLFNNAWIDKLFNSGQGVVREKMLEVMTRTSVVTFSNESEA